MCIVATLTVPWKPLKYQPLLKGAPEELDEFQGCFSLKRHVVRLSNMVLQERKEGVGLVPACSLYVGIEPDVHQIVLLRKLATLQKLACSLWPYH
jgi:hypothetical protein